jgi:glucosyl-3-phosphoglycerate synthase
MSDLFQNGIITTLHDFDVAGAEDLDAMLNAATRHRKLGLILPVTAGDMRAEPFDQIVQELRDAQFVDQIVVVMGVAPDAADYREAVQKISVLGDRARVLWTDGARVQQLYADFTEAGMNLGTPGKGRSVWTAFGYLLADPQVEVFALHDCDIRNYRRSMLARLCLPMMHPALDFAFCKAFYARYTDRLHGRVCRLLVTPLLRSLITILGENHLLRYLDSFRYPLSGEFAVTSQLAQSNRIPCNWGLEVGTLAEVFRNTSIKRVCQVELCHQYDHKHQALSLDDPGKGLMKMATDILTTVFRTLAPMGTVFSEGLFITLRSAYLRAAQDAVRQFHADAIVNGLKFDRHSEEVAIEGFARQITVAGEMFLQDPVEGHEISNWSRVLAVFPDAPERIRAAVADDSAEFAG